MALEAHPQQVNPTMERWRLVSKPSQPLLTEVFIETGFVCLEVNDAGSFLMSCAPFLHRFKLVGVQFYLLLQIERKQLQQHRDVYFVVFCSVFSFPFFHLIGILCLDVAFLMAILIPLL